MRVLARAVLTALVLLVALPAAAEHEIWYRYTVLGYVIDDRGFPLAGARVELMRDRTQFTYLGETDADGFYVIVARLGDESAGETLTLRLGSTTAQLIAIFDAANHTDERGTRVDVTAGRAAENRAAFRATLARFVGATAR